MKKIFTLISAIYIFTFLSYSQKADKHYLFPAFKPAVIHFKSGNKISELMNYNIVFRQMVYQKENNLLALSTEDIKAISKIEIDGRTFIPFEKGVSELVSVKPYIVAEYNSIMKPQSVDIGMGASTTTTAASRVSHLISGTGDLLELKNLDIPEADLTISYYIYIKNKLKKIRTVKQFMKAFSNQKNQIEEYLSENKTFNFKNPDDFKQLYFSIEPQE